MWILNRPTHSKSEVSKRWLGKRYAIESVDRDTGMPVVYQLNGSAFHCAIGCLHLYAMYMNGLQIHLQYHKDCGDVEGHSVS